VHLCLLGDTRWNQSFLLTYPLLTLVFLSFFWGAVWRSHQRNFPVLTAWTLPTNQVICPQRTRKQTGFSLDESLFLWNECLHSVDHSFSHRYGPSRVRSAQTISTENREAGACSSGRCQHFWTLPLKVGWTSRASHCPETLWRTKIRRRSEQSWSRRLWCSSRREVYKIVWLLEKNDWGGGIWESQTRNVGYCVGSVGSKSSLIRNQTTDLFYFESKSRVFDISCSQLGN